MSQLDEQHCRPCEGGIEPLAREAAAALMSRLEPRWALADDGRSIQAEWRFKNFFHTMSFVNAVAHIANTEDHHPDFELGYGYCRLRFNTHAIGGLSQNDFICAAKVDRLKSAQ